MPSMPLKQFRPTVDNEFILNAIRHQATADYRTRVPEATQANVTDVVRNMMNHTATRNEFVTALVNQFGEVIIRTMNWSNPLAKFKRGMLEYGDSIEEVYVGLINSYVYDADRESMEKALFGQHVPNIQAAFHRIDRQEYYPITVNRAMLKRAFAPGNSSGLITMLNEIMAAPHTSDSYDEFMNMTSLFKIYDDAEGFFNVQVQDLSDLDTSNETSAKSMLKKIRSYTGTLQFPSPHYNAAGVHAAATVDKLELFTTPSAMASIDVDALAGAFNVGRADIESRTTIIPDEHFNMPGTQAILTTSDFFVVADTLFETTSQPNAVGLTENFFLHHHQIISASPFVPAVKFSTSAGDVINVSDTPVASVGDLALLDADFNATDSAKRGEYSQITGAAVTTPEGGVNDQIMLSITGAMSGRTYITNTGTLHVSLDEAATSITVHAVALDDLSKTKTLTVQISGERGVVFPNGAVTELEEGDEPVEEG